MAIQRKLYAALAGMALLSSCVVAPVEPARAPHAEVGVGITVPVYPRLVLVPGYPVYYAPSLELNFFFYDGVYWVFHGNGWYLSYWYNGPWRAVQPALVPRVILQVPLRYYRRPPSNFGHWKADEPPHWDEHWGRDWDRGRDDDWKRPPPGRQLAPLPNYQRDYSGKGYPERIERQREIERERYHYQPQDPAVRRFESIDKSNRGRGNERGNERGGK
jgi:hypothetical protein